MNLVHCHRNASQVRLKSLLLSSGVLFAAMSAEIVSVLLARMMTENVRVTVTSHQHVPHRSGQL